MPKTLLKAAYFTLANPVNRSLYDRLLTDHSHMEIINMQTGVNRFNSITTMGNAGHAQLLPRKRKATGKSGYQPLIKHYCAFCKTPCSHSPCVFSPQFCDECASPLCQPYAKPVQQPRRVLERLLRNGVVKVYRTWPGQCVVAEISDLSPTGVRITCQGNIDSGQLVKIDGNDFKAVGEVIYNHSDENKYTVGIRFITVHFNRQKGQFLAVSA